MLLVELVIPMGQRCESGVMTSSAFDNHSPPTMEVRVQRLERLMYLMIGLQLPQLLPYLTAL